MATDKLVITIDGDSSGLQKALTSAQTRLTTFNQRVTNSSRSLTRLMGQMTGFGSSMSQVTSAVANVASALNNAATRMNSFGNSISRVSSQSRAATSNVSVLSGGFKELILTIYSIRAALFTGKELFGGIVSQVVDTNAQFERMQILLKNVSGGTTDLQKNMIAKKDQNYLWNLAEKAPVSIDNLTETFVHMKAAGLDPARGSLQALLDINAKFGGSEENFKKAQLALTQMASSGRIMMQDLKLQLAQSSGIATAELDFAEAAGFERSKAGITKLFAAMKKGLVESADVLPKVFQIWERDAGGAAAAMMTTWDGMMANLKTEWQKTIIRLTQDSGSNSLFSYLKSQLTDLIQFLNSSSGDDFLNGLQQSMVNIAQAVVSTVKFLYEYRDAIVEIAKVAAAFYAANMLRRALLAIVSIGPSTISLILGVRDALVGLNTAYLELRTAPNAATAILGIFGQRAVEAAQALGLLNAAGGLAIAGFAAWAIGIAAVAGVLGVLYLKTQQNKEASANHAATTKQMAVQLKDVGILENQVASAIDQTTFATQAAKNAALERVKALQAERVELLKNAQANLLVVASEANKAQANFNAQKQQQQNAEDATSQYVGSGGIQMHSMNTPGTNPEFFKAKDAANQAYQTWQNQLNIVKSLTDQVNATTQYLRNSNNYQVASAAEPKEGKDKLGSTDDKRSSLVSALNKAAELQAKNDDLTTQSNDPNHKATTVAQDAYADNEANIDNANKAYANKIKSQKELNDVTTQTQAKVKQLTQDNRNLNTSIEQQTKDQNALAQLDHTVADQTLAASEALGKLDDSYNNVSDQVARYTAKLREQYKEQLNSTNGAVKAKAEEDIRNAGIEKSIELLAEEAAKDKEKTKTITDGLKTAEQVRNDDYNKELARINNLIEAANKLEGPAREQVLRQFYEYKDALEKQHKVDNNPFAKWAEDAKDVKTKIGDSLTGAMDGFVDDLVTGQLSFKQFATSLIQDLVKIITKALIAKAILSALGLGGASGGSWSSSSVPLVSNVGATVAHTGALVGSDTPASRSVPSSMFAFAKRYHTGGFPGLSSDEVPIIAQKGEGVFTAEQMKALGITGGGSGGMASGGASAAPQINIVNQTNADVDNKSTSTHFDGEKYVVDIVLKHATKAGPMRDLMKGIK